MSNETPAWMSLSDDECELHYNPQRAVPDFGTYRARREPANTDALTRLTRLVDIPYGDHALRRLDIFPAAPRGGALPPVHLFLHGGYWRAQDKQNFAFVVTPLVAAGITVAIANYELCPASTLDQVTESAIASVEWLHRHAGEHGGDPRMISLSGHSAGAHLTAEVLATDWAARGIDPAFITGAVMSSGIYDPAPAMRTTVNADIRLTPESAARRDVTARPPAVICPAWIFAGGREPWRWIDQSFAYAHHLHRHGGDPETHVLPGYNHFDILDQYLDPASPIVRATLASAAPRQAAAS